MNIDGLGPETVDMFYENGLVRDVADLYDLRAGQLAPLPRLGEKSADNIIRSIRGTLEGGSLPAACCSGSASASWARPRPNTSPSISARSTP